MKFHLIGLCILLPFTAALPTCQQATTNRFLAMTPLDGGILENFYQNWFWQVAQGGQGVNNNIVSTEIKFDVPVSSTIMGYFTYRDASGATPNPVNTRYTVVSQGNSQYALTINRSVAVYLFKCSNNLVGGYRCQVPNTSGVSNDPEYFIWAPWNLSENNVAGERQTCENLIRTVDSSASFTTSRHP